MRKKINIIVVGYNEEKNLPKMFASIKGVSKFLDTRTVYIDQSSTDKSVDIARENGAEIYIHENKGYADPDKKWAISNLVKDNDVCLILDADEELPNDIAHESFENLQVALINVDIYFMGRSIQQVMQPRLFVKKFVTLQDTIHDYINIKVGAVSERSKLNIINNDLKFSGNEVITLFEKVNRYSSKEIRYTNKLTTIYYIIAMPVVWFFGWGLKNKNFFRGVPGFIHAIAMAYYQFLVYAKRYEELVQKR